MTAASPAATASATSLRRMLEQGASASDMAAHLDALAPTDRLEEVIAITGSGVKRLYEACGAAAPVTLVDILPEGVSGTRIYEGRNSLPAFTRFQKRFTRLPSGQLIGYNHQLMVVEAVTGPGYFAVKPPSGKGEKGDELYFDYTEPPESEPAGWPPYKPNEAGLSRFVYANMLDYMRRVARGVFVGKAYKLGKSQNAYFSLTYVG